MANRIVLCDENVTRKTLTIGDSFLGSQFGRSQSQKVLAESLRFWPKHNFLINISRTFHQKITEIIIFQYLSNCKFLNDFVVLNFRFTSKIVKRKCLSFYCFLTKNRKVNFLRKINNLFKIKKLAKKTSDLVNSYVPQVVK